MKPFEQAKSRLRSAVADDPRLAPVPELAKAFFLDVLSALHESPAVDDVIVVGTTPELAAQARRGNAMFVDESSTSADDANAWSDLNAAVAAGFDVGRDRLGADFVVSVAGDLASLRSESITTLIQTMLTHDGGGPQAGFVSDWSGHGTAVLGLTRESEIYPMFGNDSAANHRLSGAVDITAYAAVDVRLDVDTLADLQRAVDIGVGPHTSALLTDWPHPNELRPQA